MRERDSESEELEILSPPAAANHPSHDDAVPGYAVTPYPIAGVGRRRRWHLPPNSETVGSWSVMMSVTRNAMPVSDIWNRDLTRTLPRGRVPYDITYDTMQCEF
jgi:hypothetical protein